MIYHQRAELIYFARKPKITPRRFAHGIFRRGNESAIERRWRKNRARWWHRWRRNHAVAQPGSKVLGLYIWICVLCVHVYIYRWQYWGCLIVLWLFYLVCILYCGCFNLFCNVWVYVCVGFVMCGCFGNMCTCIYCVLYCLYCMFVFFRLCIFILIYY